MENAIVEKKRGKYKKKRKEQELTAKQCEAIGLLVHSNLNKQTIAAELSVRPETISIWLKKPKFMEALQDENKKRFNLMAVQATNILKDLMTNKNSIVSLGAVKEVLSKAGYDAVQKTEVKAVTTISVTVDDDDEEDIDDDIDIDEENIVAYIDDAEEIEEE